MKNLLYITLFAILFVSCEDVIDVKLNDEDMGLYAIEADITTVSQPYVFLYKALAVTVDQEYAGISNAEVTISDDAHPSNSLLLVEDPNRSGFYTVPSGTEYFGVTGRNYTLTIKTDDVIITASEYLAPVEKIDSISIRPSLRGEEQFLGIFTYGLETPGIGNFYKWEVFINDTMQTDIMFMPVASDEFVDGNYINGLEIFTDYYNPHSGEGRKLKYMDTVRVSQKSISQFSYYYMIQMQNQAMAGSPFSVPPANIRSNFSSSDGSEVLGIFTACDISVSNRVVIDESIESQLAK